MFEILTKENKSCVPKKRYLINTLKDLLARFRNHINTAVIILINRKIHIITHDAMIFGNNTISNPLIHQAKIWGNRRRTFYFVLSKYQ